MYCFLVAWYGFKALPLTLKEERRLRVFQNMLLSTIFRSKRDEIAGDFRNILKYQISWKCDQYETSSSTYTDRHDKFNCRFPQLIKQSFEKISNTKFHENGTSRSWVLPRTQTDMKNVTFDFRNELNRVSKNSLISNFMKFRTVRDEFFHAHKKDITNLLVAFRN